MSTNDIAAFPMSVPEEWALYQEGMSLRDYFAGQALVGLLAGRQPSNAYPAKHIAETSYTLADAMLKERGE